MLYNDTVTIFNLAESSDGDSWYPTVIYGVHLQVDTAANLTERGPDSADSVSLHIRFKKSGDETLVSGVPSSSDEEDGETEIGTVKYLSPLSWSGESDKTGILTFRKDKDFIYCGEWGGESPVQDEDYGKKGFFDYMKRNEDDVYLITNVGKYNLLPHFEIGGK